MSFRYEVEIPRQIEANDFGFWRLGANNYRVRASVVFRLQCETYFNERVAMESVRNEGREGSEWGVGRGRLLGDRGSDVRGGTASTLGMRAGRDDH